MLFKSLEEAQQASMLANSVAHGAAAASFFGRTLSLFSFILVDVVTVTVVRMEFREGLEVQSGVFRVNKFTVRRNGVDSAGRSADPRKRVSWKWPLLASWRTPAWGKFF